MYLSKHMRTRVPHMYDSSLLAVNLHALWSCPLFGQLPYIVIDVDVHICVCDSDCFPVSVCQNDICYTINRQEKHNLP